jgi:hypothetical protein
MRMNKLFRFFISLIIACFIALPGVAYIERDLVTLRVMDKAAGKTQLLTIPLNQNIQFDNLILNARNCKQSDPFDAENFFVFVEIYTKTDGRIFSGWMNRNEPGQNPLQNDTYDVWVEKCE